MVTGFWTTGLEGTKDRMNASLWQRGTLASRPAAAAATKGMTWETTDQAPNYISVDTGGTWVKVLEFHATIGTGDHHARDHDNDEHTNGVAGADVTAAAGIEGTVAAIARADHTHKHPTTLGANDHHNQSHTVPSHSGSPGGELGGTWTTPTVDGTHSGSAHHAQAHDNDEHTNGVAGADITTAAGIEGSAVAVARADHTHKHPTTLGAGDHHPQAHAFDGADHTSKTAMVKAWARVNADGTLADSYNVTSSANNSTGNYTVTWATDFANATYAVICSVDDTSRWTVLPSTILAGSVGVLAWDSADGLANATFLIIAIGDQ